MSRHQVIIALGSNTDQRQNMEQARHLLGATLLNMRQSRAVWTMPIGIASDRFLNQLVTGQTVLDLPALETTLKEAERLLGRQPDESHRGIVRIDLDLLAFDSRRLRADDWNRDYIRTLLGELLGGHDCQ